MSDSNFVTVFNLADPDFRYWSVPAGLIIISFALLGILGSFIANLFRGIRYKWSSIANLLFAIFLTVTIPVSTFRHYRNGRDALISGKASYVDGVVQNFVPMPSTGHALESFTVNGVPFSYSDYIHTGGFNNTASHGGPIREGLHVRIWYLGNDILKLQIEKS